MVKSRKEILHEPWRRRVSSSCMSYDRLPAMVGRAMPACRRRRPCKSQQTHTPSGIAGSVLHRSLSFFLRPVGPCSGTLEARFAAPPPELHLALSPELHLHAA
nr:unnamed protein product [Digitaria exilis]